MKAELGIAEAGGMPAWQASGDAARVGRVVVGVDDAPGGVAAIRFAVSPVDEDLRTGITNAEYRVAFEIDDIDPAAWEGWSVLVQGPAHHIQVGPERESALNAGVEPWPEGDRELFVRITPAHITGRRILPAS